MSTIAFSPPDISQAEIDEVVDTLRSGWITTGPKTKQFERELAAYCGTDRLACLNSNTSCMEMTLRLLGIGAGDEVISTAYTYTATVSPILHVGATPVLVDCLPNSYEIDYDAVEQAITPRTKAIIPVDVAGILCDYRRLLDIAERKRALFSSSTAPLSQLGRVVIIADGAHSFGSEAGGQRSGTFADFTTFSFHAVKNLTTAEGGAVTWKRIPELDSEALYRRYMLMSLHGQSKDAFSKQESGAWEYDVVAPLYKCNMTDIMAAIGLAQLHRYQKLLERRHQLAHLYSTLLSDVPVELPQHFTADRQSNCHLYMVRLTGKTMAQRNAVIKALAQQGISTNVHYKPLPMLTAYRNLGFSIDDYPNALARFENEITLPLYSTLRDEDVYRVCHALQTIL